MDRSHDADDDDLAGAADAFRAALDGRSAACAESCTAGLIANALAASEGSSTWFRGGIVTYHRDSKALLGVAPGPVVTTPVAEQMAIGAARLFEADVAVSTTGAAGPAGLDGAAPGTVVLGWSVGRSRGAVVRRIDGDPATVCRRAAALALRLATAELRGRRVDVDRMAS